jgi:uncharacterized protein YbjT (DUF2867 family)
VFAHGARRPVKDRQTRHGEALSKEAAVNPILVTGGTGTLGRAVVRRLRAGGREVRLLSRRPRPENPPCVWMTGDLRSGEGIDAAVAGVTAIIHCATTLGRADVDIARHLVEAAQRAGRPHLVSISIVGIEAIPMFYYRAKLAMERGIAESGLPWTMLRTTQFHDLIARMCSVQRWSPVIVMPAGVRFQPIDVGDVADRLVEIAEGAPTGRVPDMGGPQVRSARDLAHAYVRAGGLRRPVLPIRMPGKVFRAYRQGAHLTPEHAVGRVTFEEFLAERSASSRSGNAGSGERTW